MALRHRVAYYALLALALAALAGYVATVVMVVLELTHPALGATQGPCFICMSPWVQTEFLVGAIVVLLVIVVWLMCVSTALARRDFAWSLAFLALLALAFGFAVVAFSGAADEFVVRLGDSGRNIPLLAVAAYLLLIPLLALFYSRHLRRAWRPKAAAPAPGITMLPPPPGP